MQALMMFQRPETLMKGEIQGLVCKPDMVKLSQKYAINFKADHQEMSGTSTDAVSKS